MADINMKNVDKNAVTICFQIAEIRKMTKEGKKFVIGGDSSGTEITKIAGFQTASSLIL